MTQYLLSLPHDSEAEPTLASMDPAELQEVIAQVEAFNTALQETGAFRFAGGLQPPSTATTVDASGDGPEFTPGPFAEAKEYLGGFWVIEADNDDDAIAWAKRASRALQSRVEVRALQEAPPREPPPEISAVLQVPWNGAYGTPTRNDEGTDAPRRHEQRRSS